MKQGPKDRYWGGWLNAGKKSSHILYDKAWNTEAFSPNVFAYNLLQDRIVEYVPHLLRQRARSLYPDEYFLYSDLISNYWASRAIFIENRLNAKKDRDDEEGQIAHTYDDENKSTHTYVPAEEPIESKYLGSFWIPPKAPAPVTIIYRQPYLADANSEDETP